MPDLEPASALASRILESVDIAEAASIVRKDRAAVREPLERRIAELEALFQQTHGCHHGWVERGDRAEKRIAELEAQLASARGEARHARAFALSDAVKAIGAMTGTRFQAYSVPFVRQHEAAEVVERLIAAQKEPHGR